MKYFIYIINCLLVIAIPIVFILNPAKIENKTQSVKTEISLKKLESGVFKEKKENKIVEEKESEEQKEEIPTIEKEQITKNVVEKEEVKEEKIKTKEVVEPVIQERKSDVLETITGKMSGYGPDCKGCSGYLSSGRYVGDGNIYYNDKEYGQVRIVAGDYSYKFGTIVRIKSSRAGNNIIAIVLDRGGSIGIGKKFLFDLLYKTEKDALKDEVSYNVDFEILRYGY